MKKVLIVTLEQGSNYGGMLQAYALQRTVRGFGFEAETTATPGVFYKAAIKSIPGLQWAFAKARGKSPRIDKDITIQYTSKFVEKNINFIEYRLAVKKSQLDEYVAYIVGSDQVWRKPYTYVPHNLFSFVRSDASRISYAASFGRDDLDEYGDKLIAKTKKLAQRFDAMSVREDSGVDVAKKYWGVDAEHHVDPTLLIDAAEYVTLVENEDLPLHDSDGEIFAYVLDTALGKQGAIERVAKVKKMKSFTVIDGDENGGKPMPPVTQWIKSFIDAEYVVTDSFHGTVFSVIFNKPFVAIGNKERGLARFTSLLKMFGLEDRFVTSADEVTEELINREIDWDLVNAKIKSEQKRSFDYLKKHLG